MNRDRGAGEASWGSSLCAKKKECEGYPSRKKCMETLRASFNREGRSGWNPFGCARFKHKHKTTNFRHRTLADSANALSNRANAFSIIPTNAGASTDKRTMLSGAGRGREEPDRRVDIQGSGQSLTSATAKRYGKDSTPWRRLEAAEAAGPATARRQAGLRRTSRRWSPRAAAGGHQEGHLDRLFQSNCSCSPGGGVSKRMRFRAGGPDGDAVLA